jgi:hypothetical protein
MSGVWEAVLDEDDPLEKSKILTVFYSRLMDRLVEQQVDINKVRKELEELEEHIEEDQQI